MRRALAILCLLSAPLAIPAPSWAWPVAAPHSIVRPYLAPATPYGPGHRGIDLRTADGVVTAPAPGVVHFAGIVVDRPVLSIRHPGGLISSYEPVTSTLTAGTPVRRGELIGSVVPGHCASPCLHFGVRLDGQYVNPLLLLGGLPYSVLLPTR
ncbi:MAG: M23 family metallopeptidase [Rhodoglobus sp.]